MFLGALLDAGLSRRALVEDLGGLGLEYSLRVRKVRRGPLSARYFEVIVPRARSESKAGSRSRPHRHSHGRSYLAIEKILKRAKLDATVRERALAIFEALGQRLRYRWRQPVFELVLAHVHDMHQRQLRLRHGALR